MLALQLLTDIAMSAVALLVALLAVYLALRLLGKVAKVIVTIVAIVLVVWLLFADASPLSGMIPSIKNYVPFL